MSKIVVSTENAPAAIGPYSQGIVSRGVVYTSGQLGIDPKTGNIEGTNVVEQTEQVMKNLDAVLKAAGSSLDLVVKTTCFLADMADFASFNAVYSKYLTTAPARSCVAVKTLPKGALVEVEAIAEVENAT